MADMKQATAEAVAEWISVKESLPQDGEECLIVVPSINVKTHEERLDVFHGNFYAEELSFSTCEEGDFFEGEYTHWMRVPEPPTDKQKSPQPSHAELRIPDDLKAMYDSCAVGGRHQLSGVTGWYVRELIERIARLEGAIRWANGEVDEFPERKPGEGAYWWRKELTRRARLEGDREMSVTDRFSPREDVEWAKGAFDDGYEARAVYGASIDSGPSIEQVGAYCARSWRAGWCDADMNIMADILANDAPKGISDPLTERKAGS